MKFKRFIAAISAAVMIGACSAVNVSAGTTETIFMQENVCVSNLHKNYPIKQTVETIYNSEIIPKRSVCR